MKVTHMTSVHSPADLRIFRKECRSLAQAGFEVTVIGAGVEGVAVKGVAIKSVRKERLRIARMTRTTWRVYRSASSENADIYHFHDPELIPFALLLLLQGRLVIYDIHEDLPKDVLSKPYLPSWIRPSISWIVKRFEDFAASRFSALVAVTPTIADRFRSINPKTIVVHNFPCADELMAASTIAPWHQRSQSVIYIGGISVQRAIREMVWAMSLLPVSMEATLELAGPEMAADGESKVLETHPGWKRVRYHGFLSQARILQMLHAVKAGMVLFHPEPNHVEAMPQKIFEYMGAGLPIIASDFPLWRRIIGDAGCGIFVDPRNPREIADAIQYVLSHPSEAEEMGQRGRAAVEERFNWNREAVKLVDLYTDLGAERCAA